MSTIIELEVLIIRKIIKNEIMNKTKVNFIFIFLISLSLNLSAQIIAKNVCLVPKGFSVITKTLVHIDSYSMTLNNGDTNTYYLDAIDNDTIVSYGGSDKNQFGCKAYNLENLRNAQFVHLNICLIRFLQECFMTSKDVYVFENMKIYVDIEYSTDPNLIDYLYKKAPRYKLKIENGHMFKLIRIIKINKIEI